MLCDTSYIISKMLGAVQCATGGAQSPAFYENRFIVLHEQARFGEAAKTLFSVFYGWMVPWLLTQPPLKKR